MSDQLRCAICSKTFTQKSSLVRHSKRCAPGPALSLRQKSCWACANSKVRCNLQRPKCSRCEKRGTPCDYVIPRTRDTRFHRSSSQERVVDLTKQSEITTEDLIAAVGSADLALAATPRLMLDSGVNLNLNSSSTSLALSNPHRHTVDPYFSLLADTDSPTNIWNASTVLNNSDPFLSSVEFQVTESSAMTGPNSISEHAFPSSDRPLWLHGQTQNTPPLVRHSMQTLLRVIKTWPRMLAKGFQTPPILHHTHTNPKTILRPMQDCTFITKAWSSQTIHDTETVRDAILHSMRSLFSTYRTLDERNLLAALQALTIYAVMLMYPDCSQSSVSLVDPSIFLCMQKVVSYVARTGLMLTEERDNIRPSWESWIHVTAKRRAVFSLYLLHWSYAVYHNIESFECSQLGFMPAPAPKFLWQSWSPQEWQSLYDSWLEQWHGAPYMMCEFAAIQAGPVLDRRTEIWLEDADELGILFFGIVNATDRGREVWEYGRGIPVLS